VANFRQTCTVGDLALGERALGKISWYWRKPLIGRFYDNSKGKMGRQRLCNKLKYMDDIKFDWIGQEFSDDRLRINLKKTFFSYDSSSNSTRT